MEAERITDGGCGDGRAADGAAQRRAGVLDAVCAGAVIVLLFALTLWFAAALPQALESTASVANGPAALIRGPVAGGQRPQPRDIEEDQPEPPLAGVLREQGPRSA